MELVVVVSASWASRFVWAGSGGLTLPMLSIDEVSELWLPLLL